MSMKRGAILSVLILLCILFLSIFVYAHQEEGEGDKEDIVDKIRSNSSMFLIISSIIATIFIGYSFFIKDNKKLFDSHKTLLFLGIVIPILFATIYLTGGTIFINMISETKGPVHWHADFEVYNCGKKLDLVDPTGMSNRVGSRLFHEHGDDRIHVEGTVITYEGVSLGSFFNVVGGKLTDSELVYPTNEGIEIANNGDLCDGGSGVLQVFLYTVEDGIFRQEKLENFENYVLSPYSYVPSGDCIIVEFDVEKEYTDKICETYRIAEEKGDIVGG